MKTDENGVRFGVRFLSRSFCFSLSSAHCLVFGFVCNWHLTLHLIIRSVCQDVKTALIFSGLLVFRRKKTKCCGIFRGKFAEKSADFTGNVRGRASDISRKKKAKFRGIFRGKFAEKSADFTGNFGGKLRQETINKKQPISLDFFWQISLKSINFASIWPALFNVFLTGTIICSFNNCSLEEWANAKDI